MNIRNLVLVAILVLAGGAAFVYFDPLDLDLLGLKKETAVAKPAPARAAAPAAQPAKPPVTTAQAPAAPSAARPAPSAAPGVPAVQSPAAAPKTAIAKSQAPAPAATSPAPPASGVAAAPPAAPVPDQATQPPLKLSSSINTGKKTQPSKPQSEKPIRPKDQDLRHCLELETDAAIAKCAGE
ncbi:MAG: hypothetical protein WBQ69_01205 [Gallionella sp.]